MSVTSGEYGNISFLGLIAVLRNHRRTILQQSGTPILGVDWMTARIHSTRFKRSSAIGSTFA
jgi:hypothetical protein